MDINTTDDSKKDIYLSECAEKLLRIKVGNNRLHNNLSRVQNDMSYKGKEKIEENMKNEPEKDLEELKKREFSLKESKNIIKNSKALDSIGLKPIRSNVIEKNKKEGSKGLER